METQPVSTKRLILLPMSASRQQDSLRHGAVPKPIIIQRDLVGAVPVLETCFLSLLARRGNGSTNHMELSVYQSCQSTPPTAAVSLVNEPVTAAVGLVSKPAPVGLC